MRTYHETISRESNKLLLLDILRIWTHPKIKTPVIKCDNFIKFLIKMLTNS